MIALYVARLVSTYSIQSKGADIRSVYMNWITDYPSRRSRQSSVLSTARLVVRCVHDELLPSRDWPPVDHRTHTGNSGHY